MATGALVTGSGDISGMVAQVKRHDVDILVLTEVTPTALDRLRAVGIDGVLPHRAGRARPGVAGTVAFSRYPLRAARPLPTTFGGVGANVVLDGGPVRLLAAHPHPPVGDASLWRADHRALRAAAVEAQLSGPVVVAGNLNATLDHLPVRELRGRGFRDAAEQVDAGWQPTWPSAGMVDIVGFRVPSLLPLDHVLLTEELVALDTRTEQVRGTDHRMLIVDVARP